MPPADTHLLGKRSRDRVSRDPVRDCRWEAAGDRVPPWVANGSRQVVLKSAEFVTLVHHRGGLRGVPELKEAGRASLLAEATTEGLRYEGVE